MNLYLISQDADRGPDTFDAAVVAAESEDDARQIHPSGYEDGRGWVRPECVGVRLIGVAAEGTERGVVLASFNAG